MSCEDLKRAEQADPCVELADVLRNDLSVLRGMLEDSRRGFEQGLHRVRGTMESLQALIDQARARLHMIDPAGTFEVRRDPMGSGAFGAPRRSGGRSYTHRGLDTRTAPGDSVRAPLGGHVTRIGLCYAAEPFRLVVIEHRAWECRVLYVEPLEDLMGRRVRQGQIIGWAQDVTRRRDYAARGMLAHVHTEIRCGDELLDPAALMGMDAGGGHA